MKKTLYQIERPADAPGNATMMLCLHGGRFPMVRGGTVIRPFGTGERDQTTLRQLQEDGYRVEKAPLDAQPATSPPEELAETIGRAADALQELNQREASQAAEGDASQLQEVNASPEALSDGNGGRRRRIREES